jgi:phenylacetate-CoA ligase
MLSSLYPKLDTASRATLEQVQFGRLKRQLEYVYARSPFYRRRFQEANFHPDDLRQLADIRRLPLLTKAELLADQRACPPYGERLCVPGDKIAMLILTSGTSGVGQEAYAMTRLDVEYGGSAWANWFYRCGVRKGDRLLLTWPLGTNSGPQGAFLGAYKLGANTLPIAPYDSETKLRTYMQKFDPVAMVVTPAYLSHLTILCEEKGITPKEAFPSLKIMMIATEAYPPSWAQKIQAIWSVRVHELYGNTQHGGLAAGSCEQGVLTEAGARGCLHMDEWTCLYEVLDPETHEPVEPGAEGEMVLTNLFREGSPLVRFRTNDRVRFVAHRACSCGRPTHAIEAGTVARYDDMIKIRTQNVWPEAVDATLFAFPEVEEYQGRVYVDEQGKEQVEVRVEFKARALDNDARQRLLGAASAELRRAVGVSMRLVEAPSGSLERFVFKTRRWTDERKTGLERVLHTAGGTRKE